MNLVYIIGKIVSEIDFKFTYKSNKNAVSVFKCKLDNGSLVKVKAFNNNADFCYINLKKGDIVIIEGTINSNDTVNIRDIIKI